MPVLHRVFPYLRKAQPHEPGGALYVPSQGGGRLDNPDLYAVLYLSDTAAGAIAEAFGRFPVWSLAILAGSPSLPGSVRAIASYQLADGAPLCDLDDPGQLRALRLRPSDVVSRDYERTRGWARRVYQEDRWAGVRWWSYYDPRWSSTGLWDLSVVQVGEVRPLSLTDPALIEASRVIVRPIV